MVSLSNRENRSNTGLRQAQAERVNVNILLKRYTRFKERGSRRSGLKTLLENVSFYSHPDMLVINLVTSSETITPIICPIDVN